MIYTVLGQWLQMAIVISAAFTLWLSLPTIRYIVVEPRSWSRVRVAMSLGRLSLGLVCMPVLSLLAFGPQLVSGSFQALRIVPALSPAHALLAMILLYLEVFWFASIAKAMRKAIRAHAPHPWDAEKWLDEEFILWALGSILVTTLVITVGLDVI